MGEPLPPCPLSRRQRAAKRGLDLTVAVVGLLTTWWLILLAVTVATAETRTFGLFVQRRVGRDGRRFSLCKVRTMYPESETAGSWTIAGDARITRSGAIMRRFKLDELPQLINVLMGHMSLVGPRPDVPGFADELTGADRVLFTVRPGITGPATVYYRHEEELLAAQDEPERYNREVLFPAKTAMNRRYLEQYSVLADVRLILATVGALPPKTAAA
jgi:lipopolysaccharide/colanic/teichoic acid biosynthesis glycosyltransferase